MLRCQQNILAQTSLCIFVLRISVQNYFFCSLSLWDVIPASAMSFGNGKKEWRRAKVSHSSTANPMKQLRLGGKKWDTNLQTCSNCKVGEDAKCSSGHSPSTNWTERHWLLTPEQVFMQSGVTFRVENRSAGCKTSVNSLISSTNSPGLISQERSKVTSCLAQNYEKISKSQLRGGSFPSEQATFAREKSQLFHR